MGFHHCRFEPPEQSTTLLETPELTIPLPSSLARAVPKRQAEFLAGRYCAYKASAALNHPLTALAIREDRSPDWPTALIGSITHTTGIAACLTGLASHYRGLGVDMEWLVTEQSAEALRSQIVTDTDKSTLDAMADEKTGLTLLFSAKEAVYKAIHPTVRRYVDFKEVSCLAQHEDNLVFGCEPALRAELPGTETLKVNYRVEHGLVTTWCVLPR